MRSVTFLVAALALSMAPRSEASIFEWTWVYTKMTVINGTSNQCRLENIWASPGYQSSFYELPDMIDPGGLATVRLKWLWKANGFDNDNSAEFGFTCNGQRYALQAKGNHAFLTVKSREYLHFVDPDNFNVARGIQDRGMSLTVVNSQLGFGPTTRVNDGYVISCRNFLDGLGEPPDGCRNPFLEVYIALNRGGPIGPP